MALFFSKLYSQKVKITTKRPGCSIDASMLKGTVKSQKVEHLG